MTLIFGSTAAKHWFDDFRDPKDLDVMTKTPAEREQYWIDSFQYIFDHNSDREYVDPNFLLTIKLSHVYFTDRYFKKTIDDIHFLRQKGVVVDEKLYRMLVRDWKKHFGARPVNLNKPNEQFFQDNVRRQYEHDYLHERVAFYDRPLFERIKDDLSKAACSKELFYNLSEDDRIKCCQEEIYVTAIERFLLKDLKLPESIAIINAMKLLITSMSQASWFARYIAEHFHQIRQNKPQLRQLITAL